MQYLNVRVNLIVPNVSWGLLDYEADIVSLTKAGYATEVEIKVSKSDLRADFKKLIQHDSNLFKYFYYAVPDDMRDFALSIIPESAGLLVVYRNKKTRYDNRDFAVITVRSPKINPNHVRWCDKDRMKLAELGCMRLLGMKKKIIG